MPLAPCYCPGPASAEPSTKQSMSIMDLPILYYSLNKLYRYCTLIESVLRSRSVLYRLRVWLAGFGSGPSGSGFNKKKIGFHLLFKQMFYLSEKGVETEGGGVRGRCIGELWLHSHPLQIIRIEKKRQARVHTALGTSTHSSWHKYTQFFAQVYRSCHE